MVLDNIIKRQTLSLIVIVTTIIIFTFSILYILFFEIDSHSKGSSDFDISFCTDKTCNKTYYNYNNLIGVKNINNKTVLNEIKKYKSDLYAIMDKPYIFTIKNNISDSIIDIKLKLKKDYIEKTQYNKYINSINIAISNENEFKVYKYNNINDYILSDIYIKNNEVKKFYIWIWSSENDYNDIIYFPLSVEIQRHES